MTRTTWILAGILVLLVATTVWVLQRPGEQSSSPDAVGALVAFDSAAVDRIDILMPTAPVSIAREDDRWMLTAPLRAPADAGAVDATIGMTRALTSKTLVSSNPAKQHVFQLDSTAVLLTLSSRGTAVASIRIGKPDPTYTGTYVRKDGSDEVYLVDGILSAIVARPVRDWRNKAIVRLRPEDIRTVRFHYGDTTFTLARTDSLWMVDGLPASEYTVRGFLASLASLQCDEFIDTARTTVPPLVGMLDVDGTQIGFHQRPGDTMVTVIASTSSQIYTLYGWRAEQVLKRKADLVQTTP